MTVEAGLFAKEVKHPAEAAMQVLLVGPTLVLADTRLVFALPFGGC